jgi:hypothetical protein
MGAVLRGALRPIHFLLSCHPRRRQPIGDLVPQSPWGSPLSAFASAGMTRLVSRKKVVIPEGVSLSGTLCRKVLGGPRSPLRFGGDDTIG